MAKTQYLGLDPETIVEVVAISKTDKNIESITIAEMTYSNWLSIKKKPNFQYLCYQKSFHSFKKS